CVQEVESSSACTADPTCLCTNETISQQVLACTQKSCLPGDIFAAINATTIACNAPIRDVHAKSDIVTITLTVFATVVVALRLLERLLYRSGVLSDDYFVAGSALLNIANSVVCVRGLSGNGLGRDSWTVTGDQITSFLRYLYVGSLLYTTTVFCVKFCILLFYLRIFPGTIIRKVIWASIALNAVSLLVFDIVTLTQCRPISHYWERWDQLHKGECNNINAMAWAGATSSLSPHMYKKLNAISVTIVCILRLQALVAYGHTINPTWDAFDTCYWSAIELNVGIICVCMPNIRLLLVRMFPKVMQSSHTRSSNVRNALSASRGERINDDDPSGRRKDARHGPTFHLGSTGPKDSSSTIELVDVERPSSNVRDVV
ncbi:hypothetical protein BGZ63DRAFT_436684, partial [Mariannaea sp. PMI_226]